MVHAVVSRDVAEVERIDALQATDVVSVLLRVGAPLVVRIDAAHGTEIVLRRHGVELVELQYLLALHDADAGQRHRGHDGALAAANRAIAAPWILDAVRQAELQFHRAAMAGGLVFGLDNRVTD